MTRLLGVVACVVCLAAGASTQSPRSTLVEWAFYGNDQGGTKYSPLTQITRDNASKLQIAWEWKTGEIPLPEFGVTPGAFQNTPLRTGGGTPHPQRRTPNGFSRRGGVNHRP